MGGGNNLISKQDVQRNYEETYQLPFYRYGLGFNKYEVYPSREKVLELIECTLERWTKESNIDYKKRGKYIENALENDIVELSTGEVILLDPDGLKEWISFEVN